MLLVVLQCFLRSIGKLRWVLLRHWFLLCGDHTFEKELLLLLVDYCDLRIRLLLDAADLFINLDRLCSCLSNQFCLYTGQRSLNMLLRWLIFHVAKVAHRPAECCYVVHYGGLQVVPLRAHDLVDQR